MGPARAVGGCFCRMNYPLQRSAGPVHFFVGYRGLGFTQVQAVRSNSYAIVQMSRWLVRDCNLDPCKVALIRLCNARGLRWVISNDAQIKYMNSAAYLINNSNGIVYSSGDRNTDSILYHFRIYRMCRICFMGTILWIAAVYVWGENLNLGSIFYVTSTILSLCLVYASYERARYAARASFRGLRSLYLNRY